MPKPHTLLRRNGQTFVKAEYVCWRGTLLRLVATLKLNLSLFFRPSLSPPPHGRKNYFWGLAWAGSGHLSSISCFICCKVVPKIFSVLSPLACLDSRVLKARAASPSGWNLVWLKSIATCSQDAAPASLKATAKFQLASVGPEFYPMYFHSAKFNGAFISAGEWDVPVIQIMVFIKYLSRAHSTLQCGERDKEQSSCPGKLPAARHEWINYRRK